MKLTTLLRRQRCLCFSLLGMLSASPLRAQAPLSLFNGTSLLGWTQRGGWAVTGGAMSTSGVGERSLFTAVPFGDFDLQFEYSESTPLGATFQMWASHDESGGIIIDLDTVRARNGVGGIEGLSRSSLTTVSNSTHRLQITASHGSVTVRVDGQRAGSASGVGSKAGYLGFKLSGDGQFSVKAVKITPLNLTDNFNGVDLGGWKSVARGPEAKGGLTHTTEKVFTFGMGGGSTKPHEARWTVKGNAIHGESGPGALEYGIPAEDAVIHITAAVTGNVKGENFTSLSLRNTPGQLNTGYAVGIGPYAGTVDHVNKYGLGKANATVDETIAIGGRTVATWVGGNLLSVVTDSRPDATGGGKGARTQPGTMQLVLPTDGTQLDVTHLSTAVLAKPYGLAARAPAPPSPVVTAPAASGATAVTPTTSGDSAATQALLKQQQDAQKKEAEEQATKQRASALMSQALASTDPQEQENLYSQVIQIDPSNPNAMQGYKEAQSKLQQQQSASAQAANSESAEKHKEQQANTALIAAQSAFLGGHLSEASNALSAAERLTPNNPMVRELRSRIGSAQSLRSRLYFLGGGAGMLALAGGLAAWLRRRKLQRYPVLEITSGIDSGKVFRIEKDETHIGAVPQDAGQRNDIVVRDVEHAISRFHCQVVKRNGQLFVQDLNSSNGTRVDGERLKPGEAALLRKGTRIQLAGTVEMRFGYERARTPA